MTAVCAIATAVLVTLPKMFSYLDMAVEICRGPTSCDWKDFVPALLCFALSLTAFLPTWIKDSGGLVGALGSLVDKIRGKKA